MIVTLCGSTKFKELFTVVEKDFSLQGHIVFSPVFFEKEELSTEQKIQLDNLQRQKISMSDAIYVIDKDKYIGESTYGEIDWAQKQNKQIVFMEPLEEPAETAAEEVKE